eukprot:764153-Hanusia_phi.AAC.6
MGIVELVVSEPVSPMSVKVMSATSLYVDDERDTEIVFASPLNSLDSEMLIRTDPDRLEICCLPRDGQGRRAAGRRRIPNPEGVLQCVLVEITARTLTALDHKAPVSRIPCRILPAEVRSYHDAGWQGVVGRGNIDVEAPGGLRAARRAGGEQGDYIEVGKYLAPAVGTIRKLTAREVEDRARDVVARCLHRGQHRIRGGGTMNLQVRLGFQQNLIAR